MSVVIKGVEAPISCNKCFCCDDDARFCMAKQEYIPTFGKPDWCPLEKPKWCPLVELPEKHGDLVDASALLKEFELARKSADMDGREYANAFRSAGGEISTEWWAVEDMVENAAVVVEAEGE